MKNRECCFSFNMTKKNTKEIDSYRTEKASDLNKAHH